MYLNVKCTSDIVWSLRGKRACGVVTHESEMAGQLVSNFVPYSVHE